VSRCLTLTAADLEATGGFVDPDTVQTEGTFTCPCGVPIIAAHSLYVPQLPIWVTPDPHGAWTITPAGAAKFLPAAERQTTAERFRLHYPDCPAAVQTRRVRRVERAKQQVGQARRHREGVAA
jgi:hypothetical protein